MSFKTVTINVDVTSVDIPTMVEMSDEDYRLYIQEHFLYFVDPHLILRSTPGEYPIATTTQQLDILIEELQKVRLELESR